MFGMGVGELVLLGAIAVLLFGSRLPEVARTLGQHYNQLRRGLQDIQREMTSATSSVNNTFRDTTNQLLTYDEDDYEQPTAPQFEVPQLEPPTTQSPVPQNATDQAAREDDTADSR